MDEYFSLKKQYEAISKKCGVSSDHLLRSIRATNNISKSAQKFGVSEGSLEYFIYLKTQMKLIEGFRMRRKE